MTKHSDGTVSRYVLPALFGVALVLTLITTPAVAQGTATGAKNVANPQEQPSSEPLWKKLARMQKLNERGTMEDCTKITATVVPALVTFSVAVMNSHSGVPTTNVAELGQTVENASGVMSDPDLDVLVGHIGKEIKRQAGHRPIVFTGRLNALIGQLQGWVKDNCTVDMDWSPTQPAD